MQADTHFSNIRWGSLSASEEAKLLKEFGVSTGTTGMFLLGFAASCGAAVILRSSSLYNLCSTFLVATFEPIPAQPKTRGIGDNHYLAATIAIKVLDSIH